jgi:hypothetical protein
VSTSGLVEVRISQSSYERLRQYASRENRSITELVEESIQQAEERREAMRRSADAMRSLQEEAARNGTASMTMDEINEEIAAARREMASARQGA